MSASDTPSSSIFDFLPEPLASGSPASQPGKLVSMRAQYVVDLSFSFHQPFFDRRQQMETRMGVHVDATSHHADMHEVRLSLKLEGHVGETRIFEAELVYGGLTWSEGTFTDDQLGIALHIDAANLLYPMARQVLLDQMTCCGCAVALPTPNFAELYDRHLASKASSH